MVEQRLAESGQNVDEQWSERGWPAALLARARTLRISDEQIERMLFWAVPLSRFELEVEWVEKVIHGSMRYRQVTVADNESFCELWSHAPEEIRDWVVTAHRGPSGFAQFELQERPVLNALFDGTTMVACVGFSLRTTIVGGRRVAVRYGQAMRVHEDHRRHGYANWVRSIPWAIGLNMPTEVQYDFIRGRNMTMERWNRSHMAVIESVPKRPDDVPGEPVTVLQYPAKIGPQHRNVRPARIEDVEACVALINRTHQGRDLFRPLSVDSLVEKLDPPAIPHAPFPTAQPYSVRDFYVAEDHGSIVACAGAWDRGRDVREHWRHPATGDERTISVLSTLDTGYAEGHADALAAIIERFMTLAHELRRTYVVAPLETMPDVAELLASHEPILETRYMQWRADSPRLTYPVYLDLVYW